MPVTVNVTCVSAQVTTFLSLIDSAWVGLGVESKAWDKLAASLHLSLRLAALVNVPPCCLVSCRGLLNRVDDGRERGD
ncbi:hypothetical protein B0T18DRAFT_422428 [Schizothecium vesticola]|uniref:Uncharacterized protein n=1 Tax=Schizothecium vesticola TaxID=314040 RepID=A0AA40BQW5_9PEZI|nr:hypothetical protein B0T18DRAFT_422428 [Schizothecium vesticola]